MVKYILTICLIIGMAFSGMHTFSQVSGDLDQNGRINHLDLMVLASHWNRPGSVFPKADLNGDGILNTGDLFLLSRSFKTVYETTRTYDIRDYYPLQMGNQWHWIQSGTLLEYSEEVKPGVVLRDKNGDERQTILLEDASEGIQRFLGYRDDTLALFRISYAPENIFDVDLDPEADLGGNNIRINDVYSTVSMIEVSSQRLLSTFKITYLAAGEPVEVPAGRFEDTLKYELVVHIRSPGATPQIVESLSGRFWYARGVGIIKQLDFQGNTLELHTAQVNGISYPLDN
jgi:Dockerin type I domain